ncbi:hypothetical protein QN277_020013 [Acacia crassicarpa]|uniref:Uncharacterized protein n=1 Tax=Acacia crassicarpa TaxID=499986 RepID=A0AAE1JIN3_9FABA|nr:hypothetical protein QN277_020013 [Acacia crassicarpa]
MARFSSVLVLMLVVPLLMSLTLARSPSHKILSPAESPVPAAPPKTHHSSPSESPVEAPAMSPSSVSGSPSEAPVPAVSSANLNRLSIAGSVAVVVMAVALVM